MLTWVLLEAGMFGSSSGLEGGNWADGVRVDLAWQAMVSRQIWHGRHRTRRQSGPPEERLGCERGFGVAGILRGGKQELHKRGLADGVLVVIFGVVGAVFGDGPELQRERLG